MFGTFTEEALAQYEALVHQEYKEKQVRKATQGNEWADSGGVGPVDSSYLDSGESQDRGNYSEWDGWSFTQCLRSDGTRYGIADGKKCRKGTETKAEPKVQGTKRKERKAVRKRGETVVGRDKAERALKAIRQGSDPAAKATERRAEKGKGDDREEQVRRLQAKAYLTAERLRERLKRMVAGPRKDLVSARIARLQTVIRRLDGAQKALRDAKPEPRGEGFGRIPEIYETGRGLA